MTPSSKTCSDSVLPTVTWLRNSFAAVALLAIASPSVADLSDWRRYDSDYFIGYSDANPVEVLDILVELEYVRAAADQTPTLFVPTDRPRTVILLPATRESFAELTPYETVGGFAQQTENGAIIVMPADGGGAETGSLIRHEFGHTMLFNEWFRYPHWYAEGFSEIISAIEVDRRRGRFTIGARPQHYGRRVSPEIDWNELISEGFNAHDLIDPKLIRSAYIQNWLLVHYLVMNPDNALQLERYFGARSAGQDAMSAFTASFGMTPAALWEQRLSEYAKRPTRTTVTFAPQQMDIDFVETPALAAEIEPMLDYFESMAAALRPNQSQAIPLEQLTGSWAHLQLEDPCSDQIDITYDVSSHQVRFESFYSAVDADPVPAIFDIQQRNDGATQLTNVTADSHPNVIDTTDFRLSIKSSDVMCLDAMPFTNECRSIWQRCDADPSVNSGL